MRQRETAREVGGHIKMDQVPAEVENGGVIERRCGKAAMIRWILLDHEIDDTATERKEGRG